MHSFGRQPVCLICPADSHCYFFSDVLCDEEISQYIRDNFLVWGADVTQPDGFECQKMFQVRICIFCCQLR